MQYNIFSWCPLCAYIMANKKSNELLLWRAFQVSIVVGAIKLLLGFPMALGIAIVVFRFSCLTFPHVDGLTTIMARYVHIENFRFGRYLLPAPCTLTSK